jgi:hypothetical protein
MLRAISELIGIGIAATDGEIGSGSVRDFYFDDLTWTTIPALALMEVSLERLAGFCGCSARADQGGTGIRSQPAVRAR